MGRAGKFMIAATLAAVVSIAATVTTAGAAPGRASQGSAAPTWKVGDCFEAVDVDDAAVDLSTKVSCERRHAVQIVGGADLPSALRVDSREALLSSTGPERTQLDDFATETCAPSEVLGNLYPKKQAKALARLFAENDIFFWEVPAKVDFGILLPDDTSFDAGAKAVLCVFLPEAPGSATGDLRGLATGEPLEDLRLCYERSPGSGTDISSCAEDHDLQNLIQIQVSVRGLPVDVGDWPDSTWGEFDGLCREFGEVLVGAKRKDLAFRVNTDGDRPPEDDMRFMWCETYPVKEGLAMPGGVSVVGLGKAKIKFAKDASPAR